MKAEIDYIGVSVGALILNEKGEIFLNKRSKLTRNEQGCWEAPGGAVDFNEIREDAVKREIKEEFGIDIEIIKTLQVSDEILSKHKQHWVATTYIAKIKRGQKPKIMEPHKCDGIGWFSLENLPSPLSYITTLDIKAYKKSLAQGERFITITLECFVKKDGKYLMLHRNKNKRIMPDVWMAPGGKREFNEGLFEAARREIMEETGLEIKNLRVKATGNAYLKDLNQELYFHFIVADYAGGKLMQNPKDGKLVWLKPKEIAKLPNLLSEIKKVLPYLFTENDKVISYKAVYEKGNRMVDFIFENS